MASSTQWTWVWISSGSWWWTGRPGVLQSMGRKESDMTELLNWSEPLSLHLLSSLISNYLNLLIGTQGRSWRLNEAYFLQTRNGGHKKVFVPRSPTGSCSVLGQVFHSSLSHSSRGSLVPLSAIGAVSSTYPRLLIFLLAILIPACASPSLAFHMMYSEFVK